MRDQNQWSISLGRWGGVQVRLHALFLLFGLVTLYFGWLDAAQPAAPDRAAMWMAAASLTVLFVAVLVHEAGHLYMTARLGGDADRVILGPWGGLSSHTPPPEPAAEFVVCMAGPAANVLVCLLCLTLMAFEGQPQLLGLLNPLKPERVWHNGGAPDLFRLTFWVNWTLTVVNLLPVFPFDGGRALRAVLVAGSPQLTRRHAGAIVARLARLGAFLLLAVAWLVRDNDSVPHRVPMWLPLTLLSVFLYFGARQEEEARPETPPDPEVDPFGYDFSAGFTSLDRSAPAADATDDPTGNASSMWRWLEQRREQRRQRQRQLEADEEQRVDEILAQVHRDGLSSLTADERALLDRVAARYRSRQRPRA